ncbi:hypothetical protein N9W89_14365, partial [Hellea sp.]|nr:hypothetical protein [Hellea sp.]
MMEKTCPHCYSAFGKAERSEFVKAQFFEFLFCRSCKKKVYIVVPQSKRAVYSAINIFSYLLPLILAGLAWLAALYFYVTKFSFRSLVIGLVVVGTL